ncbi:hypothetical protein [Bradyrhizobium sp. CCGUVB14]|uniref:hypothetical protein n=1 Tax=Bradyrhizobium sp. CCGUVB14 TaxID=2949628 RepID=UPI0020B3D657|nr:hypothetical protein [Bradyrhizobium sp. CCGUVB14]MCP3444587.1 hypothetical protein [Bradyrhizobium sp. CCGUVB14]
MIKTPEQLRSELVDALESFDDAEQEGKVLSRHAIATLCARRTETLNAIRAAEFR